MPRSLSCRSAFGIAVLMLVLLAGCAPQLAAPKLPNGGPPQTPAQVRNQSQEYVRMGRTALKAGDLNNAAGLFEQALLVDPDNPEAALGFGDALLRLGRAQEASEVYARAFTQGGARAHEGYGRAMIALGRPEAAIVHLQTARGLSPDDPVILNALGVAYDQAGQHDEAMAAYKAGLALAPDDRALRNNLGLSLALAGEPDAAIATLRQLAEGPGSDRRARQNLALAYGLKGDETAAERLSRLDLSESEVRNNLAIFAALRAGDANAAKALVVAPPVSQPPTPREAARRTPPSRPVPLGALALDAGDLATGASPVGAWVVNLGRSASPEQAVRRWEELLRRYPKTLSGLAKLAGAGQGPEPLLVGPVPDKAAAQAICTRLRKAAPACAPLQL